MIAVDAMGGDFSPQVAVRAAYAAARLGVIISLFGDQHVLKALLDEEDVRWSRFGLTIVDCSQSIGMGEDAVRAVVSKNDSSLVQALRAVAQGDALAVVTAGHSGAVLVAASLHVGRLKGVSRPAIGSFIPTLGEPVFCIDLGANPDAKPEQLRQFALMGAVFVKQQKDKEKPRVGLLSNGVEPYKGCATVKGAYALLNEPSAHFNFGGNCEPTHIFEGLFDVIVCDGFVGNIMLKSVETTVKTMMVLLSKEFSVSWLGRIVGYWARPFFRRVKLKVDYSRWGGALLLGVKKPVIIAHGSSDAEALKNAILFAADVAAENSIKHFGERVELVLGEEVERVVSKKLNSEVESYL